MTFFCNYKNILGEPGKGIHTHIMGLAYIDIIFTIIGAYLITCIFPNINLWYCLLILFIIGIICHRLFCVRTKVDRLLFN